MARRDRDMPDGVGFSPTPTVDEQSKAAAMRAAAAAVPAAQAAIKQTPEDLIASQANALIKKLQGDITTTENVAAEIGALNPKMLTKLPGETNASFNARVTAAYKAQPQPVLTDEEKAQGYTIQFVRTGAGGEGEYRKIAPLRFGTVSSGGTLVSGNNGNSVVGDTPSDNATLVSTETDEYGNVIGFYSDGTSKTLVASGNKYKTTVDEDAYAILAKTFADYGLDDPEILKAIQGYMERGLGSEQAGLELRKTTAYINRFRGNEIRRAAGLNVLSEDQYLGLEKSYNETLRAYGLQGYFGTDRKIATAAMANIIGNDISAVEFKDRIDIVSTRVNNADPNIRETLRKFYNITDTDLVKYFLNPKENLPKLQEKVTAAEIGSEFIKQGLVTGLASAEEFARLGVDKAAAQRGAETIAAILPETTKLGNIYDEESIDYTQKTAEEEIIKGLDSARRKRLRLAEKEISSFSGSSGMARGALGTGNNGAF